jgi:hypothetical protein
VASHVINLILVVHMAVPRLITLTRGNRDPGGPTSAMYGLVVIRLSIKVYNSADIPDGEGPAKRRMTHWAEWTMGPPP